VTTYRPFYDYWARFFGPPQRVTYFVTQPASSCVTYGPATQVPTGSPYYAVQPGAIPGTTSINPSSGIGAAPPYGGPFDLTPGGPTGNQNVPADNAPRLDPNEVPGDTLFFRPPTNSTLQSTAKANLDEASDDGRSPQTQTRRGNFFNVTPIRDPESKSDRRVIDDDPQLLGPGNHTAKSDAGGQLRALAVVPIQWGSVQQIDAKQPKLPQGPKSATRTGPRPVRQNFDDGGWQSAQ
jgi:hypothetical protein